MVLAVAALAALRRRGAVSISGPADLALAAAPVLVAAAGALLLWRAVPALLGGVLRLARGLAGPARSSPSRAPGPRVRVAVRRARRGHHARRAVRRARQHRARRSDRRLVGQRGRRRPGADASCRTRRCPPSRTSWPRRRRRGRRRRPGAGRSQLFGVPGVDAVRVLAVDPAAYGDAPCPHAVRGRAGLTVLAGASSAATTRAVPGALPALVPGRCWAPGRRCAGAT